MYQILSHRNRLRLVENMTKTFWLTFSGTRCSHVAIIVIEWQDIARAKRKSLEFTEFTETVNFSIYRDLP